MCHAATSVLLLEMTEVFDVVDKAQFFTDVLDIDTSAIDNAEKEAEENMSIMMTNICDKAIDILVPDELEQIMCVARNVIPSTEWTSIMSVQARVSGGYVLVRKCLN